ncbi:aquaporin AQPAe.a-like isoform X1 [Rhynchophorus ferrugineus]|uniref:aquaporin AQPAe.a-like isoform X1 n=1 Tax=Rhynchophorus ferrugineus TaxID=354439 RepID=UPI003FCE6C98
MCDNFCDIHKGNITKTNEYGTYEIIEKTKSKPPTIWTHLTIALAEYLGTTTLIFLSCTGCAGIQGEQSRMHGIFAAGFAVTAVIQTFGHISAAHVNPAVSLGAVVVQQITWKYLPSYIIPQLLGSLTGSALFKTVSNQIHLLGDDGRGVCVNKINSEISVGQGLAVEIILSIILNLANCASWDARNSDKGDSVSIRIGLLVSVLNLGGAAYTGASMNPARSFGPAVLTGDFKDHWVYWIGPTIGSLIAATIYRTIFLRYQRK